jgi:lysophospholipase L1-like esterase
MKRLVAIGDSIVHGTCSSEPFGLVENNFIKIISEKLGFDEVINYGINGTTMCPETTWRPTLSACLYVDEMLPADLAIVACGTNDYGNNIEIGNAEDKTEKTFCGALNIFFTKALKRYKKLVYITPITRKNEETNSKGYTLSDYRKAIKVVAKKYYVTVIDGEKIDFNFDKHIPDGLHPNAEGHKVYAAYLENLL